MVQQVIDVGVNADSGDGDSLYQSGNKINNNFDDFSLPPPPNALFEAHHTILWNL